MPATTAAAPARTDTAPAGRGELRERAICAAAMELFGEVSFESVTMDAVAARAKASKATIYRRWTNKADLLIRAIELDLEANPPEIPDTGSLARDMLTVLQTQAAGDRCQVNVATMRGLAYATSSDPELAARIQLVMETTGRHAWDRMLERAYQRGELVNRIDPALPFNVAKAMFFCRMGMEPGDMDAGYISQIVNDVLMPVIRHLSDCRSPSLGSAGTA